MAEVVNQAAPIIIGVDGSDSSYTALREAVRLATALGTPLRAVAVWDHPKAMYDVYAPPPGWSPENDAQQVLDDAAKHVFGTAVPPWFSTAVRQGGAAAVLVKESRGAEMLVLGSRGHGGFVGMLLGSVSSAAVAHAPCPVLIVRRPDDPDRRNP
ncbi:MAG TPA: universal stress protein [Glaciibacter sp.]|nr:universal stress protein [Glaciibacter sp.]